jgi:uncharacterized membrane protein
MIAAGHSAEEISTLFASGSHTWTALRYQNTLTGKSGVVFLRSSPPDAIGLVMRAFTTVCPGAIDGDEDLCELRSGKNVLRFSLLPAVDPVLLVWLHVSRKRQAAIIAELLSPVAQEEVSSHE